MQTPNVIGLYVTKASANGPILTVQVQTGSHTYPMPPAEYQRKGITPPIETLKVIVQGSN
jgi:hypothetical protein